MQIVIDIPEELLEAIRFVNENEKRTLKPGELAILNGTPLPKGHGALITKGQAVALVQFYQLNPQHFSFDNLIDDIDQEKPIIEADKGE